MIRSTAAGDTGRRWFIALPISVSPSHISDDGCDGQTRVALIGLVAA
jgi:hypothetical protein